jgi:hypothetical protein
LPSLNDLYETLKLRKRPEDVAEMIMRFNGNNLSFREKSILEKAARGALSRNSNGYTSMSQTFFPVIGPHKLISTISDAFGLHKKEKINSNNCDDLKKILSAASPLIRKQEGENDFKQHRLNKSQRAEAGLLISKRMYNKKWRLLKRLEKKHFKVSRENDKLEFQMISNHGLVHHLDFENFSSDVDTACFIAYYNARCNMRSVFTNGKQERPFDTICEMLFGRCTGKKVTLYGFLEKQDENKMNSTNWWAISHIYTGDVVLKCLTDSQKGKLLGKWTTVLQNLAKFLAEVWKYSDIRRESMVVRKGNDSTTWNNTAGAWNKARDNWMNLIYALGMEYILDEVCFGKTLRLMAGDVAYWHFQSGGKLDPNTHVWNKLPLPWEVFEGKATCTKQMVIEQCKEAGLDPEKSGWIAPRLHRVVEFKPTPELVNGVQISNPYLATVLKRHRFFSGKNTNFFPEEDKMG